MSTAFWIRRFLLVLACAFVIITGAQLLRGHPLEDSVLHGLLWSVISAAIFTGVNIYKWRRGQYCAICGDVPATPGATEGDRPA
jgi:ABC-type uncharacterized transport system permease subunit